MSVRVERNGAVQTVIIDRPSARGAVDPVTAGALTAAFAAFKADDDLAVAVLTGAGGHFCAGYDLKALSDGVPYCPAGDGLMGPSGAAAPSTASDRPARRREETRSCT